MGILRGSIVIGAATAVLFAIACGGADADAPSSSSGSEGGAATADAGARGVEPVGQTCSAASQCYAGLNGGADGGGIVGAVTCITKVPDGYCTHECTQDTDCCAVAGECLSGVKQVCSPLENQSAKYCFLSCEDEDIQKATTANATIDAGTGADGYCQSFAGAATSCRSSGGGSKNRKICLPK